jgi:ribosomal protein L11
MTTGEYRVGITFNPGGNPTVNVIKTAAAALIDQAKAIADGSDNPEVKRLAALAMTHFEDGAMWAVKAVTKPPLE